MSHQVPEHPIVPWDEPFQSGDYSSMTVLVVEDLPDNRELLKLDLLDELPGIRIVEAEDGVQALEILRRQDFALVICDVLLPKLDGFEVLAETRQMPNRQSLPFLFLSALQQEEAIKRGLALGAVDFVTKPYDVEILTYKVKNLARLKMLQDRLLQAQRELERVNEFLHKLNDEKSRILRLLSHDLRSPLSGVRGLVRILKETDEAQNPNTVREFAHLIDSTIEKILPIVSELTIVTQIELAQHSSLSQQQCDLQQLIRQSLELAEPVLRRQGVVLQTELAPATVIGDRSKLQYLFNSVITTLVDQSRQGGMIRIRMVVEPHTRIVEFDARNIPMDETIIQAVADGSPTMLSLPAVGLRMARLLAELHEGALSITSLPEGVQIVVTLPTDFTKKPLPATPADGPR